MSEPVKSSEIEDVLSSIRRLVSEEARHHKHPESGNASAAAPEKQVAAETEPAGADALVLTAALRVHEGGRTATDNALQQAVDEIVDEAVDEAVHDAMKDVVIDGAGQSALRLETRDATFDVEAEAEQDDVSHLEYHSLDDPNGDLEDIGENAGATNDPDAYDDPSEARVFDDTDHPGEVAAAEDFPEIEDLPESNVAASLEAKIAALEALISDQDENWEPEEGDKSPTDESGDAMQAADAIEWQDIEPTDDAPAAANPVESSESDLGESAPEGIENSEIEDAETEAAERVPTFTTLRPVVSSPETAKSPDTDTVPETAPDTVPMQSGPSTDVASRPADTPATTAKAAGLIDEDMLRGMVLDIVRDELQGALGERITRNVRRLVRREIHRALANQELR